mmetsp:Transcript_9902/g.32112  ORF Transcript_9902/g.32112 Transcript_9902/m.32112 type:complete len:124 (-) Transcript_9902:115-486(-)|eukprot:CAMPEP_0182904288 /NCGR_PEP_ID=MMETSP0034_2-20130328/31994_1 /TAXON_ID=156128 /ORGANISM="Nephroselmis pyriformis, Strain CCMP717" /LENGTH=123 /DNA_ID=CAMNT_0025039423 /DNA_START=245 /DNA_END=616 /DNA_ORIENTATION=-
MSDSDSDGEVPAPRVPRNDNVPVFGIAGNASEPEQLSVKQQEEMSMLGDEVEIVLKLPDGSDKTHKFHVGQSVAYLKAWVAKEYGIEYSKQALLLGGDTLIDPMCLNDYGITSGACIEVKESA